MNEKTRICKALRDADMNIEDEQVDFRDAEQIATWVNSHPPVATWVKEQTHGTTGPFRSWKPLGWPAPSTITPHGWKMRACPVCATASER